MDHARIVAQLLARGTGVIETIVQATDRPRVAPASLAIFEPMRQVAREILPAKLPLEAQQLTGPGVVPGGQEAGARYVQTRPVRPPTLWGVGCLPVRPCPCDGGGLPAGRMTISGAARREGTAPTMSVRARRPWSPSGPIGWPMTSCRDARAWPSARGVPRAASTAPPRTSSRGRPRVRCRRPRSWRLREGRALASRPCAWRSRWLGGWRIAMDAGRKRRWPPSWDGGSRPR
jgi:hypothetical protein